MQAEVPSSAGLLAARLVLQADSLKPCYSISKTVQTTRDRKTVLLPRDFHLLTVFSLISQPQYSQPQYFIRNLRWRGKTHPSTKRIIFFFETQSKHHRVRLQYNESWDAVETEGLFCHADHYFLALELVWRMGALWWQNVNLQRWTFSGLTAFPCLCGRHKSITENQSCAALS